MAIFTEGVLTKKGQALIAKSESRGSGINLTHVRTGAGVHTDTSVESLEQLTELIDVKQEFGISDLSTIEGNAAVAVITAVLNNRSLEQLYYLNEMGVYADDPDEGEILYCILVSENNMIYMPPENGTGGISCITERIYVEVTNAERTTINVEGAVVSATDFLALRKIVEAVIENLQGGADGQMLTKDSGGAYGYSWKDINTVTRPFEEFPAIGRKDAIYVDSDSSEIYLWKILPETGEPGYFKLPLGAEASATLQKQITANSNNIATLMQRVSALETKFDEIFVKVEGDWTSDSQNGVNVYTKEVTISGMTENFNGTVFPHVYSSNAADAVNELKAISTFLGRGVADSAKDKIILTCYGKAPKSAFGLRIQGIKAST